MSAGNETVSGHASVERGDDTNASGLPPSALTVTGVVKNYGDVVAVNDLDLVVRTGECLVLLGPSGSGKTTALKLVAGFELPTSGQILLEGRDISRLPPAARGIGMVFQNYALFPHMTVAQNVAYGLRMRKWPAEEQRQRVAEMLDLVRLSDLGSRRPRELSGGQQQRVALARALAFRPRLLLMDEPLGALDRSLKLEMEYEIRRIQHQVGATILYVTHDREEAMALADRVAVMREGRLLACDTPEGLYTRPPSAFVGAFFGERNALRGSAGDTLASGEAHVRWAQTHCVAQVTGGPPASECLLTFLPSSARIGVAEEAGALQLAVTVSELLYLGDVVQARGRLETGEPVVLRLAPEGVTSLVAGGRLQAYIPKESLLILPDDRDGSGEGNSQRERAE